jgi:hypothetical protein
MLGFLQRKFRFSSGLLNVGIVVAKVSVVLVYHSVFDSSILITQPLPQAHLSTPPEACDSPDQGPHYHILTVQVANFVCSRYLAHREKVNET